MNDSSLKIIITKKADRDESDIYKYIFDKFGKQYAEKFRHKIFDLFRFIALHPFVGKPSKSDAALRVFIISKQNKLVYKVTETEIIIIRILKREQVFQAGFDAV